jgi:hypothetical protein
VVSSWITLLPAMIIRRRTWIGFMAGCHICRVCRHGIVTGKNRVLKGRRPGGGRRGGRWKFTLGSVEKGLLNTPLWTGFYGGVRV